MIAAAIDSPRPGSDRCSFRGRDTRFWQACFFPFCSFLPLNGIPGDFDFIFIFDISIFAVGPAGVARELQGWLRGRDGSKPWLVAPQGASFFIASRAFLVKEKIALKPGIFRRLQAEKKTGTLVLKHPIHGYRLETEQREIENAVVDLQVRRLQKEGVRTEDYGGFYLEGFVPIGKNTRIGSGVVIRGDCKIGKNVQLYPNCFIENSQIGDECQLLPGTVIRDSIVGKGVQLGPYCHIRNGSLVKDGAKIGNFVEMKKSLLGQGSKAMHLTYIGDAQVGKKVNIGAGTITCNYDGERKNPTLIGDNVFIGSGTELVAPVTLHDNSYVAAGSTITEDVPENTLAVARERQRNIPGWVSRKRKKKT